MRRTQSGFTLIELLIVIGIIGLLATALLPRIMSGQDAANALADQANLRSHYAWMLDYKRKHSDALPPEGGHRFVLATWTAGIFDYNPENLARFFTPGPASSNDIAYQHLLKQVKRGENPWKTLNDTDTTCTGYVGRSKQHARSREQSENEAWMANDNEGGWSLRDGTVNVLFNGGNVRAYSYQELKEQLGLPDFNKDVPIQTYGENSPIEPCKKLDN